MKRIITWTLLVTLAGSMLTGLAGCGKKGPLYRDTDKQQPSS